MQSYGKVPTPVSARADAWLRREASSSSPRAVLGISEPTEAELKKQEAAFQGKARAKVVRSLSPCPCNAAAPKGPAF